MTGKEMLKKALTLLGYIDGEGHVQHEAVINRLSLDVVNTVYCDLWYECTKKDFIPLGSLSEEIDPTGSVITHRMLHDIMPYGVAAFMAQSNSDGDNQQLWMTIYNRKKCALTKTGTVKNVLPKSY